MMGREESHLKQAVRLGEALGVGDDVGDVGLVERVGVGRAAVDSRAQNEHVRVLGATHVRHIGDHLPRAQPEVRQRPVKMEMGQGDSV